MAAFSLDHKTLINAAIQQITPGMEHICVLPSTVYVKLTRVTNVVQSETNVDSASDPCTSGSIAIDRYSLAIFGNKGALPSSKFVAWVEQQGNTVDRIQMSNTPLTKALLNQYDVIILDWLVRDYSAQEAQLLADWVENGGGLISMTGHTNNNSVVARPNSLLQPFGLSYNANQGFFNGPVNTWTHPHPLTDGITSISFKGGLYIDIASNGGGTNTVIGTRPQGPVAVAQERQAGRIFVFGDEWIQFDSEWQINPQIRQFWSNIMSWMRRKNG